MNLPPPARPRGPLLLLASSADAPLSRQRLAFAAARSRRPLHCLNLPASAKAAAALLEEARKLDALPVALETGALRRVLATAAWERGQVIGLWPEVEEQAVAALHSWEQGEVQGVALALVNGEAFLQQAVHEPAAAVARPWARWAARTPWLSLDDGPPLRAPTAWLRVRQRAGATPQLQLLSSLGGREQRAEHAPELGSAARIEVLAPWPWRHGSQDWRLDGELLTLRSPVQFVAGARPLWLLAPHLE